MTFRLGGDGRGEREEPLLVHRLLTPTEVAIAIADVLAEAFDPYRRATTPRDRRKIPFPSQGEALADLGLLRGTLEEWMFPSVQEVDASFVRQATIQKNGEAKLSLAGLPPGIYRANLPGVLTVPFCVFPAKTSPTPLVVTPDETDPVYKSLLVEPEPAKYTPPEFMRRAVLTQAKDRGALDAAKFGVHPRGLKPTFRLVSEFGVDCTGGLDARPDGRMVIRTLSKKADNAGFYLYALLPDYLPAKYGPIAVISKRRSLNTSRTPRITPLADPAKMSVSKLKSTCKRKFVEFQGLAEEARRRGVAWNEVVGGAAAKEGEGDDDDDDDYVDEDEEGEEGGDGGSDASSGSIRDHAVAILAAHQNGIKKRVKVVGGAVGVGVDGMV